MRLLGAALIFTYHFGGDFEATFGGLGGSSALVSALAVLRPHFAEVGISLFVVLSGLSFGLASAKLPTIAVYRRRVLRLLVPLWLVAMPFMFAAYFVGELSADDWWRAPVWLLGLGIVHPATYLPVSEAWWYVSLALQCVLAMPLILVLVDRIGLNLGVSVLSVVSLATLWAISRLPSDWSYLTQGLVLSRLVELAVGMLAAFLVTEQITLRQAVLPGVILATAAIAADHLGAITSAPVLGIIGCAILALARFGRAWPASPAWLATMALSTYAFYLVHAPVGKYSMRFLSGFGIESWSILIAVAALISMGLAGAVTLLSVPVVCRLAESRRHRQTG